MSIQGLRIVPVDQAPKEWVLALFDRQGFGCYCRFWHFSGDKNAWQERAMLHPELNRQELETDLSAAADSGVVALLDERAVGWLKLSPRSRMQKLHAQRPYRGMAGLARDGLDGHGVFTIGCLYVEPDYRKSGVARALLDSALKLARDLGATAVEAFPRRGDALPPEQLPLGPAALFLEAGFRVLDEVGPYPVLRLEL